MTTGIKTIGTAEPNTHSTGSNWSSLYKIGGLAALLAAVAALLDVLISGWVGGAIPEPSKGGAIAWFTLFQNNWFLGLYGLGLLNIIYNALMVPLFFVLYTALQRENQAYAALAALLLFIGVTVYLANNKAFPMLTLSRQFAMATDESQKSLLITTGQAMLAQAEDFTPGSFIGFFFSEMGIITLALVMLRSRLFSKVTAWLGLVGFVTLFIFTAWSTFLQVFYDLAVILGMVGGLFSIAWFILVSRRLFQIGRDVSQAEA